MDSTAVQQLLGRYLFDQRHTPICGNFQTSTLPECDLISVNPQGLLCEWEIKISRSDFQADFRKERKHRCLALGQGRVARRRGSALEYQFLTCSYFSYACPAGLLRESDLPPYAGLVWVHPDGRIAVVRPAPTRHLYPADADILRRINHNLTQKFLYGCSRATFATRPLGTAIPFAAAPAALLEAPAPPPLTPGSRHLKARDPAPLRRGRRP
jgi:hypothetical protein